MRKSTRRSLKPAAWQIPETMWIELTPDTLLTRLTTEEHDALAFVSTNLADVLADIAAEIAAEWRGGIARHVALSKRRLALPDELLIHILADYRYRAFTRLPGMSALLDANRVEEWRRANTVRDNIGKVQIEPPDAADLPDVPAASYPLPSISVPMHYLD